MIAVQFDSIARNQRPNSFWINTTWSSCIILYLYKRYNTYEILFSISVLFWMIAHELNQSQSNVLHLFRINATSLSWKVLPISIRYTDHSTLFSTSILFCTIALHFEVIQSKFSNLFWINTTRLNWVILLLFKWYTASENIFSSSLRELLYTNSTLYISSLLSPETSKKPKLTWLLVNVKLSI